MEIDQPLSELRGERPIREIDTLHDVAVRHGDGVVMEDKGSARLRDIPRGTVRLQVEDSAQPSLARHVIGAIKRRKIRPHVHVLHGTRTVTSMLAGRGRQLRRLPVELCA